MGFLDSAFEGMGEDAIKKVVRAKLKGTDIVSMVTIHHKDKPEDEDVEFRSYTENILETIKRFSERNVELVNMMNAKNAENLMTVSAVAEMKNGINDILKSRKSDLNKLKAIEGLLNE